MNAPGDRRRERHGRRCRLQSRGRCRLAIASETAGFVMAYTNAGLVPDGSSTFFLPRRIGDRRTRELHAHQPPPHRRAKPSIGASSTRSCRPIN